MSGYSYEIDKEFSVKEYFGAFNLISIVIEVTPTADLRGIAETREYTVVYTGEGKKGWCLPADPLKVNSLRYYDQEGSEITSLAVMDKEAGHYKVIDLSDFDLKSPLSFSSKIDYKSEHYESDNGLHRLSLEYMFGTQCNKVIVKIYIPSGFSCNEVIPNPSHNSTPVVFEKSLATLQPLHILIGLVEGKNDAKSQSGSKSLIIKLPDNLWKAIVNRIAKWFTTGA